MENTSRIKINPNVLWTILIEVFAIIEIWIALYIGHEVIEKHWIGVSWAITGIIIIGLTVSLPIILFDDDKVKKK